jgi:hypothetical protein
MNAYAKSSANGKALGKGRLPKPQAPPGVDHRQCSFNPSVRPNLMSLGYNLKVIAKLP